MTKTTSSSTTTIVYPNRWKALSILSIAQFLIILDTSIIGVALPTIQQHFNISQTELQWIFNAYVIAFGTILLLGGRLSDILGHKKIFLLGFIVLTVSSIVAGVAISNDMLIVARAIQGLGAALIAPSALSIVMSLFANNKSEMNKAMGIWGASAPAGGTAGVFLGGIITAWLDWTWVFLINVPIGIAVLVLIPKLIPQGTQKKGSIDYLGAVSITASLITLVYSIVTANDVGWVSAQTISLLTLSAIIFTAFIAIEKRTKEPLIPLHIFKTTRNLLSGNMVMGLLGAAWVSMWFFINLYLQLILNYGPFESGLALLPMTVLIMIMMVWSTPRLIGKLGIKANLIVGLTLLAIGIFLFSFTPANTANENNNNIFLVYILPASIISALGMSFAYIPALTAAIANAKKEDSGIASGLVNTTYQIGSALGLAITVAIASTHTETQTKIGIANLEAINNGFHLAFIGAAIVTAIATTISLVYIKNNRTRMKRK
ncbi:MAG: stp 1 [Nitrososphaeraceae archaeon]|jgi:EmrB/QacA subfamily drug resistance transporter|nr:stp 1 [Nitrososphaeraceae archaeon]MDF2769294.1 stp 1 [Nitrososphaeraceae archaeon]